MQSACGAWGGLSGGGLLRAALVPHQSLGLQLASVNQANSVEPPSWLATGGSPAPVEGLLRHRQGPREASANTSRAMPQRGPSVLGPSFLLVLQAWEDSREMGPGQCLQLLRMGRSEKKGQARPLAPGSPTYP